MCSIMKMAERSVEVPWALRKKDGSVGKVLAQKHEGCHLEDVPASCQSVAVQCTLGNLAGQVESGVSVGLAGQLG